MIVSTHDTAPHYAGDGSILAEESKTFGVGGVNVILDWLVHPLRDIL